jgi:hypothetical protein
MTIDDEVIQEELAKCQDGLDDLISKALDRAADLMRSKGATGKEFEAIMDWYSQELTALKQEAMVDLTTHMEGWLARDGASLN